jgi:hypothetical protein
MPHAALKLLGTVVVAGVTAAVLSSCGDDVPSGAVATGDHATKTKKK